MHPFAAAERCTGKERGWAGRLLWERERGRRCKFAAVLMTALAAGCAAAVYANSFITVEGTEGTASYFVSPLAQKALFEESEIFDDLFAGDVRDVTRMRSSAASWRRTEATTGRKGSISRNM